MARRKGIATKQIRADHWEPHETVLIRSLNTQDAEDIDDNITSLDTRGSAKLLAGYKRHLTLLRGIVSWTLTDEQGRPLPLDAQSLHSLAPEDSLFIFNEINALSTPMTEDEKKASLMPAMPGIEEEPK